MAGSPKKRALKDIVSKMGVEPILDRIAEGQTINDIAIALGTSPPMLSALLNSPQHAEGYARARERRAARHAEKIETLADRVETGDIDPQAARVSIDARKWIAARLDPGRWSENKGAQVNISFNDLHIGSLKRVNASNDTQTIDMLTDSD